MKPTIYKPFALLTLLIAAGAVLAVSATRPGAPRGSPTFDEAISRPLTVLNRAGSTPEFSEAISRAVTVLNRAGSIPVFEEGISRSLTVLNRSGSTPVFDEAISRAATVCNRAGRGDHDDDGDVDLVDYAEFGACLAGPNVEPPDATCEVFDFDCDGDIDVQDFAGFQTAFTVP